MNTVAHLASAILIQNRLMPIVLTTNDVVLNPDHATRAPIEELKIWINQNVGAKFQRIADLVVFEDFPRNAAGKTLKRSIQEIYLNNPVRPT